MLAVTTDRATVQRAIASTRAGAAGQLAVYLTGPRPAGGAPLAGTLVGGPQHAGRADLRRAVSSAQSFTAAVLGGYVVLQPVALGAGRLAITEVYVPAADVSRRARVVGGDDGRGRGPDRGLGPGRRRLTPGSTGRPGRWRKRPPRSATVI